MAIYERGKNKWQIEVILGYEHNGRRKRHYEIFYGGKKEAKARESEIRSKINKGIFTPKSHLTFGDFLDKYLEEQAIPTLSPRTVEMHENLIKEIKPELGYYKLTDINTILLLEFYNKIKNKTKYEKSCKYHKNRKKEKISLNAVLHYYKLINVALNYAVKWEFIYTNPNHKVDKPKAMKKEAVHYNPEQTQKLLKSLDSECPKYRALILLALDTGARRGELTGLNWDDINFGEKPYVIINKTTQYIKGQIIEKNPKNETSIRRVYITKITLKALLEYKESQDELKALYGSLWGNTNKVFTTDDGFLMHPDTPRKILGKIINRHNLDYINFHGLRHTSISLQIASGIQTQVISKRAGHSNITTTHMIYSHIFDSASSQVAETMNEILTVQ